MFSRKPYEAGGNNSFVDEKGMFWGIETFAILTITMENHSFGVRHNVVDFVKNVVNVVQCCNNVVQILSKYGKIVVNIVVESGPGN